MLLLCLLLACRPQEPCPPDMAYLPGGPFTAGARQPLGPWEQAARPVVLASFCMDLYEAPNRPGQTPLAHVTWEEARDGCRARGRRLCTSDEWERACRGPSGNRWSYGASEDRSACNTPRESAPPPPPPPAPPEPFPVAASGAFPACTSAEGVHDLNGNLSEWVEDAWDGPVMNFDQEARAQGASFRTVRGDTMWSRTSYGHDCLSRHGHPTSSQHQDDGYRCCLEPQARRSP